MQLVERCPQRLRARCIEAAQPNLQSVRPIDLERQQLARRRDESSGAERLPELANDPFLIFDREPVQIVDDPHGTSFIEVRGGGGECVAGEPGARPAQLAQQVLAQDLERRLRSDTAIRDWPRPGRRECARQRGLANTGDAADQGDRDALHAEREPRELGVPPDKDGGRRRNSEGGRIHGRNLPDF